jgi:DNA repair protein RadC
MTHYMIKDMAQEERPRERLIKHGAEVLSLTELLAILIGAGVRGRSAIDIARELTGTDSALNRLARIHRTGELTTVAGLGPARAAVIVAALELGRRLGRPTGGEGQYIHSPEEGARLLMNRLRYAVQEHLMAAFLNSKGKVIAIEEISVGSLNSTVAHPREIFAPAILHHAAAILVYHNHPSGDPEPSGEDRRLTRKLADTGKAMEVPLLDHIIIGDGIYYSFKEQGLL